MELVRKVNVISLEPEMIAGEPAVVRWRYGLPKALGKGATSRFVSHLRLVFGLALIALEFTNLIEFVTFLAISNPQTKRFAMNFSTYDMQFLSYGICLMVVALDRNSVKRLFNKPIVRWVVVATMVFTWGMLLRAFEPAAGFEEYLVVRPFGLRLNALAFMLSCVLIFEGENVLEFTKLAVAFATLFAIAVNLYEVAYPGTFSIDPGRSAGLYVNPNESGMAIVFGCLTGLTVLPRWWRQPFLIAAGLGVVATFSREAIVAFLIVVVGAGMGKAISYRRLLFMLAVGSVIFATFDIGMTLRDSGVLSEENLSRLSMTVSDQSARDRYRLGKMVLEKFEQAPLLGNGFDTAGYWAENQSHNLYLSFMADHGIFGILLIPALVLSLFRRSWHYYTFGAVFLVWCFFDHNLFADSFALITLAIQASEPKGNPAIRPYPLALRDYGYA